MNLDWVKSRGIVHDDDGNEIPGNEFEVFQAYVEHKDKKMLVFVDNVLDSYIWKAVVWYGDDRFPFLVASRGFCNTPEGAQQEAIDWLVQDKPLFWLSQNWAIAMNWGMITDDQHSQNNDS